MIELTSLPNDRRSFVHKKIFGGIKGAVGSLVTGGNPLLGAVSGFVSSGGSRVTTRAQRPVAPVIRRAAPTAQRTKFGGIGQRFVDQSRERVAVARTVVADPCPGRRVLVAGRCVDPLGPIGPGPFISDPQFTAPEFSGGPAGEAVMGRFGAALAPGSRIVDRAVCLRGMVLGNDGLCYNSRGFRNSDRMWPKGRKPLLTGGEMRAISIASRAGKRLENTAIRLQEIGLIKKPVARRRSKKKC